MKKRIVRQVLCATFGILGFTTNVPAAELLVELDSVDEKQRISNQNHYFLEQYRYVSSRARVVKVNTDALLGEDDEVTITLFPGVSVPVVRREVNMLDNGLGFVWKGTYTAVPMTREEFVKARAAKGIAAETANQVYDSLVSVTISGSRYQTDPTTGLPESLSGIRVEQNTGVARSILSKRNDATGESEYYDVSIDLMPPPAPLRKGERPPFKYVQPIFEVRSLEMDRRYHVVYEMDPSKTVPTGSFDPQTNPVVAEKVIRYREFKESLGEDPRIRARRRKGAEE